MIIRDSEQALAHLNAGGLVAIPTETVYGLAASVRQRTALQSIFTAKERPLFDPLIVHISDVQMAKQYTSDWSPVADLLATHFWPGPLTLILPKSDAVDPLITSGLPSVGLRIPNHPLSLGLLRNLGHGLAAPSANKFGRTSPTRAEHVEQEFQRQDILVLDGGSCDVGIESTVLKLERDLVNLNQYKLAILRLGDVSAEQIDQVLQKNQIQYSWHNFSKQESPGHMKHHYMPNIPLVLVDKGQETQQLILQIKSEIEHLPDIVEEVRISKPKQIDKLFVLELSADAKLAARELYDSLRTANESGANVMVLIWQDYMADMAWNPVVDRLLKASSLDLRSSK